MFQIKAAKESIWYQKSNECICLLPQGEELGGSKDSHF